MTTRFSFSLAAVTGLALLTAGCGQLRNEGPAGLTPPAEEAADVSPDDIELPIIGVAEFNNALADRQGKVVLVDFWATWCGPCRKKFPHTVELAQHLGDDGLEVITVSLDSKSDLDKVKSFLAGTRATAENMAHFISRHKTGQTVAEFEIGDSIPYYKVYDRAGNEVPFPDLPPERQFAPEVIETLVTETLAKTQ